MMMMMMMVMVMMMMMMMIRIKWKNHHGKNSKKILTLKNSSGFPNALPRQFGSCKMQPPKWQLYPVIFGTPPGI